MTEKTEWEIVDAPASSSSSSASSSGASEAQRQSLWRTMQVLLGPWWRWKIAGTAILAVLTLVFFITLTGMAIVVLAAGGAIALGVSKVRQWLGRGPSRP